MPRKKSKKPAKKDTMMQSVIKEAIGGIREGTYRYGDKNYGQLRQLREWCEKNDHPEAKMGDGKNAPHNHLYCDLCNQIFYRRSHPAYKEAGVRGEIDSAYDS